MNANPPPRDPPSLSARVTLGVAVTWGAMMMTRTFGLISIAFLARLLTPEDFGLMALATFITGGVTAALGRHFETALIRTVQPSPRHVGTAFALAILWGVIAAALVPAAMLLGAPDLELALRWLALCPLFEGFRNPNLTLAEKELRFKRPMLVEVGARFATLLFSVAFALILRDYWAMVIGLIAYSAANALLSHVAADAAPRPTLALWREFLAFGGWATGSSLAIYLNRRLDRAIVGAQFGLADVGRYRVGDDIASMSTSEIAWPLMRAVYPGLAKRATDLETLRRTYRKSQQASLFVLLPMGVLVALVSKDLIMVLTGPKWLEAATVLAAFAPILGLGGLTLGVQQLLYIRNEVHRAFYRDVLLLTALVPALLLGAAAGGFEGLIVARIGMMTLSIILTLAIAAKILQEAWYIPIVSGWRSLASCGLMIAAVWGFHHLVPFQPSLLDALYRLAIGGILGWTCYLALHYVLWRLAGRPDGPESLVIQMVQRLRGKLR
jgi:PST family polysaccharide transporter